MKVYFASDHAGFELKKLLVSFVKELGYEVEDCGAHEFDPVDDYPVFISRAARKVAHDVTVGIESRAIVLGKSGQGEAIMANRFHGVRAVVFYGSKPEIIHLSREHNDANVLSIGAGFVGIEEVKSAVSDWLGTSFSGDERHVRRIRQIDELSKK